MGTPHTPAGAAAPAPRFHFQGHRLHIAWFAIDQIVHYQGKVPDLDQTMVDFDSAGDPSNADAMPVIALAVMVAVFQRAAVGQLASGSREGTRVDFGLGQRILMQNQVDYQTAAGLQNFVGCQSPLVRQSLDSRLMAVVQQS